MTEGQGGEDSFTDQDRNNAHAAPFGTLYPILFVRSGNFLKADTNAAHAELARLTALRVRQVTVARCGPGCPAGTEAQRTPFRTEFCDVPECEGLNRSTAAIFEQTVRPLSVPNKTVTVTKPWVPYHATVHE